VIHGWGTISWQWEEWREEPISRNVVLSMRQNLWAFRIEWQVIQDEIRWWLLLKYAWWLLLKYEATNLERTGGFCLKNPGGLSLKKPGGFCLTLGRITKSNGGASLN